MAAAGSRNPHFQGSWGFAQRESQDGTHDRGDGLLVALLGRPLYKVAA
jgi:hypothetical protein